MRDGIDTSDIVHDALYRTFVRLESFQSNRASALRAYLQQAVESRIHDQLRRTRRLSRGIPEAAWVTGDGQSGSRGPHDAGVAGGTLHYLSPEVLGGRPASEADDVWSLCVVLYEMVSGEHPFTGDSIDGVVDSIRNRRLSHDPQLVLSSTASLPVAAFAASMLTAPRSARPTTAQAFAAGLDRMLTHDAGQTRGRP